MIMSVYSLSLRAYGTLMLNGASVFCPVRPQPYAFHPKRAVSSGEDSSVPVRSRLSVQSLGQPDPQFCSFRNHSGIACLLTILRHP